MSVFFPYFLYANGTPYVLSYISLDGTYTPPTLANVSLYIHCLDERPTLRILANVGPLHTLLRRKVHHTYLSKYKSLLCTLLLDGKYTLPTFSKCDYISYKTYQTYIKILCPKTEK